MATHFQILGLIPAALNDHHFFAIPFGTTSGAEAPYP